MSRPTSLQEADPHEPADRRRGHGALHHHAVRPHQGEPEHQDEGGGGDGPGGLRAQADHHQGVALRGQGEDRPASATQRG